MTQLVIVRAQPSAEGLLVVSYGRETIDRIASTTRDLRSALPVRADTSAAASAPSPSVESWFV